MSSSFTCGSVRLRTGLAEGAGLERVVAAVIARLASERDHPLGIIGGRRGWLVSKAACM